MRQRRQASRLSQEALAALALGNGNRKGYISTIENGRVAGLTPQTARRLAEALGIARADVPLGLQWHVVGGDTQAADAEHVADLVARTQRLEPALQIIDAMQRSVEVRLTDPPTDTYKRALGRGLNRLTGVYGPAFSFQSFAMSVTIAYVYIFAAGLLAYAHQGGRVGALRVFDRPDWAADVPQAALAVLVAAVVMATAASSYVWGQARKCDTSFGDLPSWRAAWGVRKLRVICGGAMLGLAALIASWLGVDPIVASIVIAIGGLGALADLGPRRCAGAGALAGSLAGMVENLAAHQTVSGGLEGALFGLVLGSSSFYVGALVAQRAPSRVVGGMMGAGLGVCAGAVVTMVFFGALEGMSVNAWMSEEFGIAGFAVLQSQDHTYVILAILWAVLPLVNAVQDYLSYGLSKTLAHRAVRTVTTSRMIVGLALLDILSALVLAGATVACVYGGLVLADHAFALEIAPLQFVTNGWHAPFGAGIWLTIMVMSTLFWTVLHYFAVVLPTAAAFVASRRVFHRVKAHVASEMAERGFDHKVFAASYVPNLVFLFAYLTLLILSASFALSGLRAGIWILGGQI